MAFIEHRDKVKPILTISLTHLLVVRMIIKVSHSVKFNAYYCCFRCGYNVYGYRMYLPVPWF